MKKSIILSFLIVLVGALAACKKENQCVNQHQTESIRLLFGHFYGECEGPNCIRIFKLQGSQLSEDTLDKYPTRQSFYSGNFINLSSDKYEKAKALRISFPVELLQEPNTIIGWPDVTDGGGLYIEYENNGVHKFWLIDQAKENVPTKYHSFHDQVNQIISQL